MTELKLSNLPETFLPFDFEYSVVRREKNGIWFKEDGCQAEQVIFHTSAALRIFCVENLSTRPEDLFEAKNLEIKGKTYLVGIFDANTYSAAEGIKT